MSVARKIPLDSNTGIPFQGDGCSGTSYEVTCGWCGTTYNKGLEPEGGEEGDDVQFVDFGSLTIADCCFDRLETAVLLNLADIIAWADWRARKHDQLAKKNQALAKQGAKALEVLEAPRIPVQSKPADSGQWE